MTLDGEAGEVAAVVAAKIVAHIELLLLINPERVFLSAQLIPG